MSNKRNNLKNNILKNKKTIIVAICICIVISFCFLLFTKINSNEEVQKNGKLLNKEQLKVENFNINGRVSYIDNDNILIGQNIKELQNGFYDLKIVNQNEQVIIYLNKLWYEYYGEDFIQDNYLAEICRCIVNKLNKNEKQNQEKQDLEYMLFKYIKDNYVKVRNNKIIEKINIERFEFSLELEESIVKLTIKNN